MEILACRKMKGKKIKKEDIRRKDTLILVILPLRVSCSKHKCPCTESCHQTSLEINQSSRIRKGFIEVIKSTRTVDIRGSGNKAEKGRMKKISRTHDLENHAGIGSLVLYQKKKN